MTDMLCFFQCPLPHASLDCTYLFHSALDIISVLDQILDCFLVPTLQYQSFNPEVDGFKTREVYRVCALDFSLVA